VRFFLDEATDIRVTISKLDLPDPMYRFSIGLVIERPGFPPLAEQVGPGSAAVETFFPAITMKKRNNMPLGMFALEFDYAKIIGGLVAQAQEWVAEDRVRTFNEQTEARYAKDVWSANKGKPATKHTGKTAKKKERLAAKSGKAPSQLAAPQGPPPAKGAALEAPGLAPPKAG
jgi:hypothetical protein